jgi:hypothetical protein
MRRKINSWMDNQHLAMWNGLISTQRQVRKMISGPNPTAKNRIMPFYKRVAWSVSSFLTVHNALRRHLYIT